jgi:hypothetical protein
LDRQGYLSAIDVQRNCVQLHKRRRSIHRRNHPDPLKHRRHPVKKPLAEERTRAHAERHHDGPRLQEVQQRADRIACDHMSGLLSRPHMTAAKMGFAT